MFCYHDWLDRVNEWGFSLHIKGFTSPFDLADPSRHFSGDTEHDPWEWKARAPAEKALAFTFVGRHRAYIAKSFYPVFYDAFHPELTPDERYDYGLMSQTDYRLYSLFDNSDKPLGTHVFRKLMGVTPKNGGAAVDTAATNLMLCFDITPVGNLPIFNKEGKPYSSSVGYDLCERWAPEGWIPKERRYAADEAYEMIIARAVEVSGLNRDIIDKELAKQRKLVNKYGA